MMVRPALLVATLPAVILLAACGAQKDLTPKPGMGTVPVARGAERAKTPDELMQPSSQARPDHSAEPLGRSVDRKPDPFSLPPS